MFKQIKLGLIKSTSILVTVLIFLLVFENFLDNPIIFVSFASSVFTIYAFPNRRQAKSKVVVISHLIAAFTGYGMTFIFPEFSIFGAAIAVGLASILMILLNFRHSPAAATAMAFTYNLSGLSSLTTFGIILLMILALGLIKVIIHITEKFLSEFEHELFNLKEWWHHT